MHDLRQLWVELSCEKKLYDLQWFEVSATMEHQRFSSSSNAANAQAVQKQCNQKKVSPPPHIRPQHHSVLAHGCVTSHFYMTSCTSVGRYGHHHDIVLHVRVSCMYAYHCYCAGLRRKSRDQWLQWYKKIWLNDFDQIDADPKIIGDLRFVCR